MTYVKYLILALLALLLIVVALANANMVTLRVLPEAMSGFLGWSWQLSLPMFVVVLGAVIVGLLIGFFWEFVREGKYRAAVRSERREKESLRREVTELRAQRRGKQDDVLALLEDGSVPR
ncbi:putative integral membrane protein [Palleronia aestuarii]|uniref:Putative integral membrane protein n=1 Tax=Palleronia aestuarii TaxID=568105 RepID=A0A2W7NNT9_9RHOB|nr:LapA family protein [Palleronia aestuarii]PZX18254.1 putative integral membrane protein [Palleronia aestuarii]